MITKGTENYAKAQKIANEIVVMAAYNRNGNGTSMMEMAFNKIGRLVAGIAELNCFAAQIAKTVDSSMNPYGYQVARISSKQAWILACAAIENGIEF